MITVTDATWDYAVLGVRAAEVRCELSDSWKELDTRLVGLASTHDYVVVKVPVLHRDAVRSLQESDYRFCETLISVERTVKANTLDSRLVKRSSSLDVHVASADEETHVRGQIMAGLFATDRISLDERFGPAIGARRYWNWIQSEIEQGGSIYVVSLSSGMPLGFFILRIGQNQVAHSVLSGVFDGASAPGFGLLLLSIILETSEKQGAKRIVSAISSNNLPVVRTHVQLGFEFTDMNYVFVRHINRD